MKQRSPTGVVLLPVHKILRASFNMRSSYIDLGELAVSIRRHGLLHPAVVRPSDQAYELIAGHRRLEACKLLGWREVPCLVRDLSDRSIASPTAAPRDP